MKCETVIIPLINNLVTILLKRQCIVLCPDKRFVS